MTCRIVGDRGEATAANSALPTMDDRVTITTPAAGGSSTSAPAQRAPTSWRRSGLISTRAPRCPSIADDALTTMELIDPCYRAAGFRPRPRTPRMQPPGPDRWAVQSTRRER